MTAIRVLSLSRAMVRVSSAVLPEPGLDTRLSAKMPCSAKWLRLADAY